MKRKDLPGFYWDDTRQRYFPVSSKPHTFPKSHNREPKTQPTDSKAHEEAIQDGDSQARNHTDPCSLAYAHTRTLRSNNLRFSQTSDIRMFVASFHYLRRKSRDQLHFSRLHAASIANICKQGVQQYGPIQSSRFLSFRVRLR